MGIVVSFRCAGIEFDLHDSERIPVGLSSLKYYVTPHRMELIEQWLRINSHPKVCTKQQMHQLISMKLIGTY